VHAAEQQQPLNQHHDVADLHKRLQNGQLSTLFFVGQAQLQKWEEKCQPVRKQVPTTPSIKWQ
jgi:hypothetical protein